MLTEWLILLLLVPAILVPVVLLGGFAGCGFEGAGPCGSGDALAAPTNVSATAWSESLIVVEWTNSNPSTVDATFEIERTTEGEAPVPLTASSSPFLDFGLDPGTTYTYRVRAVCTEATDEDGAVKYSEWSHAENQGVSATTFYVAFQNSLGINMPGMEGNCLVQRIEPAGLLHSGNRVKLILQGSLSGDLRINKITISEAAAAGDPYDSAGPPVVVESSVTIPTAQSHQTPTIDYALDATKPLLVAFDIGSPGYVRYAGIAPSDATAYVKTPPSPDNPISEAETADRSGFIPWVTDSMNVVGIVSVIFVI